MNINTLPMVMTAWYPSNSWKMAANGDKNWPKKRLDTGNQGYLSLGDLESILAVQVMGEDDTCGGIEPPTNKEDEECTHQNTAVF